MEKYKSFEELEQAIIEYNKILICFELLRIGFKCLSKIKE